MTPAYKPSVSATLHECSRSAREVIEQAIANLGDHAKIVSIAMDRGFMDDTLLWWLNSENIIFYIPAKVNMGVYDDAISLVDIGILQTREEKRGVGAVQQN